MSSPDLALPQVSVIIPAYNAGAFIGQAVASALASREVIIEVIVIDDGSTDDTWQVLEGFGEAIRRVRQNQGRSLQSAKSRCQVGTRRVAGLLGCG